MTISNERTQYGSSTSALTTQSRKNMKNGLCEENTPSDVCQRRIDEYKSETATQKRQEAKANDTLQTPDEKTIDEHTPQKNTLNSSDRRSVSVFRDPRAAILLGGALLLYATR